MIRRGLLLCALPPALSIALMGEVRADEPDLPRTMRLEYVRGPGAQECPTEDTLRFAIAGRMAVKPFAPDAAARLLVTIRRKGGLLEGGAEVRGAADDVLWSFRTALPECHLVMDALAIAIGLVLDPPVSKKGHAAPEPAEEKVEAAPEVEKEEPKAEPKKEDPAPAQAAPAPSKDLPKDLPPEKKPATLAPDRMRWLAGLGAAVAMRTGPVAAALDLMLGGGMRWRWFSLGAEVRYSPPATAAAMDLGSHSDASLIGITASRLVGGLTPCGHVSVFIGCALVQGGALFAKGVGLAQSTPATVPIVAGGARIGLDVPFGGRFWLRPAVDLLGTGSLVAFRINLRSQWVKPTFSVAIGGGLFAEF